MGINTRPLMNIPGDEIPESVQNEANKKLIERFSEKASGPLSLFLGERGGERAESALNRYLKPMSGYLGIAGAMGLPTYNQGLQNLKNTIQSATGGKMDKRDLRELYKSVSSQVDSDESSGYGFNEVSRAVHELARQGRLGDILGRSGFTGMDASDITDRVRHYLDSAATMEEMNQAPLRKNISSLVESTNQRYMNPRHLPVQSRMAQLQQRWNQPRS